MVLARSPARKVILSRVWGGAEQEQPHTLEELHAAHCIGISCAPAAAPFYLNGWRAFADLASLAGDCPQPAFLTHVDHSDDILEAAVSALTGRPAGAALTQPSGGSAATTNLKKAWEGLSASGFVLALKATAC